LGDYVIREKSLVIYKNRPAVVSGFEGDKISITVLGDEALNTIPPGKKPEGAYTVKVREKDIEVIHPGPCTLKDLEENTPAGNAREAWELLTDDSAATGDTPGMPLKELTELVFGVYSPRSAWAAHELLREGLYFSGDVKALRARPRQAVEEDEKKREEKQRETGDRAAFLEKLKNYPPFRGTIKGEASPGAAEELSETERRFLLDVEALALGKTSKSRTMKELGRSESSEEAHRLLLASGAWTVWVNPHPSRFGLGPDSAKIVPPPPPDEKRLDLTGLAAYAIDNPWSDDPDDAVSLEVQGREEYTLWVHVADPAASVLPGSPVDLEARGRGVTLYLPEGASRMLAPEALSLFALGFGESGSGAVSPALSFKISLKPDLSIGEVDIIPSLIKVTRLSYADADVLIAAGDGNVLTVLAELAERNQERRLDTGAVVIDFPEVHIKVNLDENHVTVEPDGFHRSADMVRECMIWAGEGAARWALQRRLPFPFISQEAGELPANRLDGFAGAWQLRRCMRPRILSARPGVHWGLGLDEYTQVTSPLRRYTDLLCHQQIRSFIGAGMYQGQEPLGEDEVLLRLGAAEAAASVASKAERASRAHWMAVYLADSKDSNAAGSHAAGIYADGWEGIILDRKGNKGTVLVPDLGLETQLNLRGNEEPNDKVQIRLLSVKIPEGELNFGIE